MNPVIQMAMSAEQGGPLYQGAVDICDIRGVDPHEQHHSNQGFILFQWQRVLAEIMIANQLYMMMP
jgi:hypothetical protein